MKGLFWFQRKLLQPVIRHFFDRFFPFKKITGEWFIFGLSNQGSPSTNFHHTSQFLSRILKIRIKFFMDRVLLYILQILPDDRKARRFFVTMGGLRKVQELQQDGSSGISEYITIINCCFPEEIIRYIINLVSYMIISALAMLFAFVYDRLLM